MSSAALSPRLSAAISVFSEESASAVDGRRNASVLLRLAVSNLLRNGICSLSQLRDLNNEEWRNTKLPVDVFERLLQLHPMQGCGLSGRAIDSTATGASADAKCALSVNPFDVHFTHDRISPAFRSGTRIDDAIQCSIDGSVGPQSFPPLEVVRFHGKLFSISNRRLFMLRVLAQKGIWTRSLSPSSTLTRAV